MQEIWSQGRFDEAITALGGAHPGRGAIQEPDDGGSGSSQAHVLAKMDPFSADYRAGVLDLYATLRTRVGDTGYVAERDEASESVATSRPTHGPGWYRGASGT